MQMYAVSAKPSDSLQLVNLSRRMVRVEDSNYAQVF